jgi:hypothetical protein
MESIEYFYNKIIIHIITISLILIYLYYLLQGTLAVLSVIIEFLSFKIDSSPLVNLQLVKSAKR